MFMWRLVGSDQPKNVQINFSLLSQTSFQWLSMKGLILNKIYKTKIYILMRFIKPKCNHILPWLWHVVKHIGLEIFDKPGRCFGWKTPNHQSFVGYIGGHTIVSDVYFGLTCSWPQLSIITCFLSLFQSISSFCLSVKDCFHFV